MPKSMDDSTVKLPAIMAKSGFREGLVAAGIIGAPIAAIGLILPPPFSFVFLGGGALIGVGLGVVSSMKIEKAKNEWRVANGLITHPDTVDATVVETAPRVPMHTRAIMNATEAVTALSGLKYDNTSVGPHVRKINSLLTSMIEDVTDNHIEDMTVMDFMLTQIPQYKTAVQSYIKLRVRILRTETETRHAEITNLDNKIIRFLEKVEIHVDSIKSQAIEQDEKKLSIDLVVMDRMIDTVATGIRQRVRNEQ